MIDVSDALMLADLVTGFQVIRQQGDVDPATGRTRTEPRTINGLSGTICAASGNDLDRLDDSQRMGRNISIVTLFPLRGPAVGYQPDLVVWNGDRYLVKLVDPYPHAGGFVQAIAGSVDAMDQPMPAVGTADGREPTDAAVIVGAV